MAGLPVHAALALILTRTAALIRKLGLRRLHGAPRLDGARPATETTDQDDEVRISVSGHSSKTDTFRVFSLIRYIMKVHSF